MASLESSYYNFESTMDSVIKYFNIEGKVSLHNDHRNYLIGVLFKLRYKYLYVIDILNFDMDKPKQGILDGTVIHIREVRDQFNYYFNAIWC